MTTIFFPKAFPKSGMKLFLTGEGFFDSSSLEAIGNEDSESFIKAPRLSWGPIYG